MIMINTLIITVLSLSTISVIDAIFVPYRITYDNLIRTTNTDIANHDHDDDDTKLLFNALTNSGIVSITGLPYSSKKALQNMIQYQNECLLLINNKQIQVLNDGTIRHTLAIKTQIDKDTDSNNNIDPTTIKYEYIDSVIDDESMIDACNLFDEAATIFRTTTNHVIDAFTQHLSYYLNINHIQPLLDMSYYNTKHYETASSSNNKLLDVVKYGIHLEHFHSYIQNSTSKSSNSADSTTTTTTPNTIDLHVDQGLFLTFTPGRNSQTGEIMNGFYIQTSNGNIEQVQFENDMDDIIFMLGDGVNQYINQYHDPTTTTKNTKPLLRAVPHSLQLFQSSSDDDDDLKVDGEMVRVWYGIMILPPPYAIHPKYHITFHELRQGLMNDSESKYAQLACSNSQYDMMNINNNNNNNLRTSDYNYNNNYIVDHRMLNDEGDSSQCDPNNEIYCWHRCMNITEFSVSHEICDETFQLLACINPRDQLWSGTLHGDYYPGCIDTDATNETTFPTLPNYPRDDSLCTNFDTKFNSDGLYQNSIQLDNGNGAIFEYTIDENDVVKGRLIFNGIFGYIGFGFAGTGSYNTMQNGRIILATRGIYTSARYGLDLTTEPSINEYIIDPEETTFRIWGKPYTSTTNTNDITINNNRQQRQLKVYDVTTDDCYTILTFETNMIADQKFKLDSSDTLIWAANNVDTYMQYHGMNRGTFTVQWMKSDTTTTGSTSYGTMIVGGLSITTTLVWSMSVLIVTHTLLSFC